MPPCRFCLGEACEYICPDCKAKVERLKLENEALRKQLVFLQRQARTQSHLAKVRIVQSLKPRKK